MANTWKTLSDGDLVRKALPAFTNALKFIKTINKQYDPTKGRKNGGVLLVKDPIEFTVRSGATMNTQDISQTTQSITMATQRGVDIDVSSIDHTLSVEDFEENVLKNAMTRLAAEVEYIVLSNVYKDVFNFTGTGGSAIITKLAIHNAYARLSQGLAPVSDRHLVIDSPNMATAVNSFATYFHPADEVEKAFNDGLVGHAAGFKWWETNMVPSHTAGTRATTALCNTSTGITSGTATIATTGGGAATFTVGDVITVGDVYAINRETKNRYTHLQPFVVTAAATEVAGAVTLSVSPTPVTSGAKQNVELVSPGASKTVTRTVNGAASSAIIQPMAYHRDAFTFVTADLYTDPSQRMTISKKDDISLRLWRSGDIVNDTFPLRFDVLFGYKTLRPEWAARVNGE